MIVRPEEISASSAPSTSPLKHCEMKVAQLITISSVGPDRRPRPAAGMVLMYGKHSADGQNKGVRRTAAKPWVQLKKEPTSARGGGGCVSSGVVAEIAAERLRLLHQRLARKNFHDLPEV